VRAHIRVHSAPLEVSKTQLAGRILRLYAYLYHFVFALFLLGLSLVALMSSNTLKLPILPWQGEAATQWLLWGSILGLVSIGLAVTGVFRYLFPLWALAVLIILVRGYILQPIPFSGADEFQNAMLLTAGALLAFLASLTLFTANRRRRA
jgi:hypothetical protein